MVYKKRETKYIASLSKTLDCLKLIKANGIQDPFARTFTIMALAPNCKTYMVSPYKWDASRQIYLMSAWDRRRRP